MGSPIVVAVERSGFVESAHLVDVAVVDATGELVGAAGEPTRLAAFRSCAKPIQARVCLENGWKPHDQRSLAVACASHNGEPAHIEWVRKTLSTAGLTEDVLRCPDDVPLGSEAALAVTSRSRIYHNCSGKHAAMLATSATNGWPVENYSDPEHPLQARIGSCIDDLTGGAEHMLVDGCGVPTFTASLAALARAFRSIFDGGPEATAMRAHPFLVGGTAALDTDVMTIVPEILIKSGAEGLVCVATKGYGITLKLRDGNWPRARGPAVILVLRSLGLLREEHVERLQAHAEVPVYGGGNRIGRVVAHGGLEKTS